MSKTEYGIVYRRDETHGQKALVIYSTDDGFIWHEMVECEPEWAQEIVEALWVREAERRRRVTEEMEELNRLFDKTLHRLLDDGKD